jgi:hypothetical protein
MTPSKLAVLKSQWDRKQQMKDKTIVGALILK